jgi:catechol 2,3-dioxygenase-like lactoylglutathione lyase family enzyme
VLDHVGIRVSDFEQSKRFYTEALSPLGYELSHGTECVRGGVRAAGQAGLLDRPR